MATRFYLTNTAAPYTPATKRGAWDLNSATLARLLGPRPSGATATAAVAETSATGSYDVLWGRWISAPAYTAGTLSGTAEWVIGVLESNAAADMTFHVHIYVTTGDSDTVRGTALTDSIGATEFTTTQVARTEGAKALSSVSVSAGDRLVVEIGYRSANTVTTSYTGTMRYGGTTATDLAAAATSNDPPWIDFSAAEMFFPPISGLTDTFPGALDTSKWSGSWGGPDATGGVARVPCTHTGGVINYAGISYPSQGTSLWRLRDSSIMAQVVQLPAQSTAVSGNTVYCEFRVESVEGTFAAITYDAMQSNLRFQWQTNWTEQSGTVDLAYSAVDHVWWRIRVSSEQLLWETSANGSTWTTRRTLASPPSWVRYNGLGAVFEAGRDAGTNDFFRFDNVNTLPVQEGSAALSAASGLTAAAVPIRPAAAALSAATSISAAAVRDTSGATALSAASALSAAAVHAQPGSATLSAASGLSAAAVQVAPAATALSTASGMTAGSVQQADGAAALSAASGLSAAAVRIVPATADLSAAAGLSAAAVPVRPATADLSAASGLSAAGVPAIGAATALSAASTMTVVASGGVDPESLFVTGTGTDEPTGDFNDNTPTALGVTVHFPAAAGTITHVRFRMPSNATGTYQAQIFEVTAPDSSAAGTAVTSLLTFSSVTPGTWNQVAIPGGLAVETGGGGTGKAYRVVVYTTAGRYTARSTYFASFTKTSAGGGVQASANNADPVGLGQLRNGVYGYGAAGIYPSSVFNGGNYYVDVVFQPPGGTPEHAGAATLSADSGLSVAATRDQPGAVALSAASGFSAGAVATTTGATALSAASGLSAAAVRVQPSGATMSAASGLSAAAVRTTAVSGATLSAASGLSAAAAASSETTVDLSVASGLSAAAVRIVPAGTDLSAASGLSAGAVRVTAAAAELSAGSGLNGDAVPVTGAAVLLQAATVLEVLVDGTGVGAAALSAGTGLQPNVTLVQQVGVQLAAATVLLAGALRVVPGTAPLSAVSGLSAVSVLDRRAVAVLSAGTGLTAVWGYAPAHNIVAWSHGVRATRRSAGRVHRSAGQGGVIRTDGAG